MDFSDSPRWPQGEAGKRHDGARSFQTGIEPGSGFGSYDPPGAWNFYTYWQDMRSWQGPQGTSFYGNGFAPELLKGIDALAATHGAVPTAEGVARLDGVTALIGALARRGRQ